MCSLQYWPNLSLCTELGTFSILARIYSPLRGGVSVADPEFPVRGPPTPDVAMFYKICMSK